jgi:hypothetical protein
VTPETEPDTKNPVETGGVVIDPETLWLTAHEDQRSPFIRDGFFEFSDLLLPIAMRQR